MNTKQSEPSSVSNKTTLFHETVELLKSLISTPSYSKEEHHTAKLIESFFHDRGIKTCRKHNNIWVYNKFYDPELPCILLNSHHDTVKPNKGYTKNPFEPVVKDGKLYGLGSNDAGGALVSLIACFLHFYEIPALKYNLILAATGEEENSGSNGVESILGELKNIACGIVGEPTQMNPAIAEKGLMVIDCIANGQAGHAAREEGINAIYTALKDIEWIRNYKFPEVSEWLGDVKMSVTMIQAGIQHNIVPDKCYFTIDVRSTDKYSNEEILKVFEANLKSELRPRSMRLNPSAISIEHPLVKAGMQTGRQIYGSPTTSDQALMKFPTIKIGPGDSARSHSADEFIYLKEISEGIELYIEILEKVLK